jgi:hypothetical protein
MKEKHYPTLATVIGTTVVELLMEILLLTSLTVETGSLILIKDLAAGLNMMMEFAHLNLSTFYILKAFQM